MKYLLIASVLVLGFIIPPQHAEATTNIGNEPGIKIETYEQRSLIPEVRPATTEYLDYASFHFAEMGTYANDFSDSTQCTWGVASMKGNIPWRGNANTWDEQAVERGIVVSDVPIVGAIAQTDRGTHGHVAVVTAVYADHIVITEKNYDYHGSVRTRTASYSEFRFIYL